MIAGLDSSFDRPSSAQASDAYAAGVRVWGGYIGTRGALGLATLWSQADFDVVKAAGMSAIGFCSGWEDPAAIRDLAAAWGVLLCVDVESGIRNDGPWVQGWLDVSGAGLYGLSSVHSGRSAAFHIVAWYGATPPSCWDPGATWPNWLARPAGPLGWQFCGTHNEFSLSVDRGWYDDSFAPAPPPPPPPPPPPFLEVAPSEGGTMVGASFRPGGLGTPQAPSGYRLDLAYLVQRPGAPAGHCDLMHAAADTTHPVTAMTAENLSSMISAMPAFDSRFGAQCYWDDQGIGLHIQAVDVDGKTRLVTEFWPGMGPDPGSGVVLALIGGAPVAPAVPQTTSGADTVLRSALRSLPA